MKTSLIWALASLALISVVARYSISSGHRDVLLEEGYLNAARQPGYEEVKNLGGNPLAGDASVAEAEWFLFHTHCSRCHGSQDAQPQRLRAAFGRVGADLSNIKSYRFGWGDLAIFRSVKYGFAGSSAHQSFDLGDRELWILSKYLRRLQFEARR
ncbi:c-type cytochrome [bacterium]|nr:c-type cytochrome [bacterium]